MNEPHSGDESGVWWDGALNPMSQVGIRAAMAEEDDAAAFKASDIRWVAWPGYGHQVHVSQVEELRPIWTDLELRRLKRRFWSTSLLVAYMGYSWIHDHLAWGKKVDAGSTILGLLTLAYFIWSLLGLRRDPKVWGLALSRRDARRAGIHLGV